MEEAPATIISYIQKISPAVAPKEAVPMGLPVDCLDGARSAGARAGRAKGEPQEPQRGPGHTSGCRQICKASCWTLLTFKHWCIICKDKLKHSDVALYT